MRKALLLIIMGIFLQVLPAWAAQIDVTKENFRSKVIETATALQLDSFKNIPRASVTADMAEVLVASFARLAIMEKEGSKSLLLFIALDGKNTKEAQAVLVQGMGVIILMADPTITSPDLKEIGRAILEGNGTITKNGISYALNSLQAEDGKLVTLTASQAPPSKKADFSPIPAKDFRNRLIAAAKKVKATGFNELPKAKIGEETATIKHSPWLFTLTSFDAQKNGKQMACMVVFDENIAESVAKKLIEVFNVFIEIYEPGLTAKQRGNIIDDVGIFSAKNGETKHNGIRYKYMFTDLNTQGVLTLIVEPL